VIGAKSHIPVAGTQLSVVHRLLSLHTTGVNTQPVIAEQLSVVHRLPSLQVMVVWVHVPPLQLSVVHMSLSLQFIGAPGEQTPLPLQVSAIVQASPSSHIIPAATGSPLVQFPVPGSQPPWKQTGGAGQVFGLPDWQLPPEQASFSVQALPSVQATPLFGDPGSHVPLVGSHTPSARQTLFDGQLIVVPPTHTPAPSQ
jgi:hypothetical protein